MHTTHTAGFLIFFYLYESKRERRGPCVQEEGEATYPLSSVEAAYSKSIFSLSNWEELTPPRFSKNSHFRIKFHDQNIFSHYVLGFSRKWRHFTTTFTFSRKRRRFSTTFTISFVENSSLSVPRFMRGMGIDFPEVREQITFSFLSNIRTTADMSRIPSESYFTRGCSHHNINMQKHLGTAFRLNACSDSKMHAKSLQADTWDFKVYACFQV